MHFAMLHMNYYLIHLSSEHRLKDIIPQCKCLTVFFVRLQFYPAFLTCLDLLLYELLYVKIVLHFNIDLCKCAVWSICHVLYLFFIYDIVLHRKIARFDPHLNYGLSVKCRVLIIPNQKGIGRDLLKYNEMSFFSSILCLMIALN